MTIHREGRQFYVQCDFCSNADDLEADDFGEAVADLREKGYRPVKLVEGWQHMCGSCVEDQERR